MSNIIINRDEAKNVLVTCVWYLISTVVAGLYIVEQLLPETSYENASTCSWIMIVSSWLVTVLFYLMKRSTKFPYVVLIVNAIVGCSLIIISTNMLVILVMMPAMCICAIVGDTAICVRYAVYTTIGSLISTTVNLITRKQYHNLNITNLCVLLLLFVIGLTTYIWLPRYFKKFLTRVN